MDVALLLSRERGERRRFPLTHDVITMGRGEGCDFRIPLGDVSRKHCSLVRSDDGLVIQDIGSSNGTFVNGKKVREAALRAGDQIRIGSLRFIVQIDGVPSEEDAEFTTLSEKTVPETVSEIPEQVPADDADEAGEANVAGKEQSLDGDARDQSLDGDLIDVLDDDH